MLILFLSAFSNLSQVAAEMESSNFFSQAFTFNSLCLSSASRYTGIAGCNLLPEAKLDITHNFRSCHLTGWYFRYPVPFNRLFSYKLLTQQDNGMFTIVSSNPNYLIQNYPFLPLGSFYVPLLN